MFLLLDHIIIYFIQFLTGKQPWYGYEPRSVVIRVALGQQPNHKKYDHLEDTQWGLLQDCWAVEAVLRPHMCQIIDRLQLWELSAQI
jgi:hypothetical protein